MKNFKMPKLQLPLLKYFWIDNRWKSQKSDIKKDKNIQGVAHKIEKILSELSSKERNLLVSPPISHFDPEVTIHQWNDFLAVMFGIKPSCNVGMIYNKKLFNPIGQFARNIKKEFPNICTDTTWDFALKNNNMALEKVDYGFIYDKSNLTQTIKRHKNLQNINLDKISEYLYNLSLQIDKNPKKYHKTMGILLGYNQKSINKFIE